MSFQLIDYTATEKQYSQYNGRIAIVIPWWPALDEPFNERYTIITPLKAEDFPHYIGTRDFDCHHNTIYFQPYQSYKPVIVDTTDMPKFTERQPVKPPVTRWDKYGERKVYSWKNGHWYISGYEKKEER